MKKSNLILSLFLLVFPFIQSAQSYNNNYNYKNKEKDDAVFVTEWEYEVYTAEFNTSRKKLEIQIAKLGYTVVKQDETKFSHTFHFNIPKKDAKMVDSIIATLGYISSKELRSYDNTTQLNEANLQLQYLQKKKEEYEKMQFKIDSVKSVKYYEHWEKTREVDQQIFEAKKKLALIESVEGIYKIKVIIRDETTSPSYTRVNFVHMPGAEYTYLMIEQPKQGLSHEIYQGINIKYLFTKGKSYFEMGAFKAAKNSIRKDSVAYSELFVFDFGQDFYSRYFGRGNNKFMNLYIGYKTGVAIASNDHKTELLPTVSPSVGVELFKNKYVLFDVKAAYFLPIIQNRHLRGWAFSGSFNFVF
ncbi:MAG: hypothetical protein IAF38_14925 [Bacteroidia bacterium]|nr:hypothetical protein [Bacteroidia bacterium]